MTRGFSASVDSVAGTTRPDQYYRGEPAKFLPEAHQVLGEVDRLVAMREGAVARLSDAAKHQAFPQLYARPIPRPDTTTELTQQVAQLMADNKRLTAANKTLREQITGLSVELEQLRPVPDVPLEIERVRVTCAEVIEVFLGALKAGGFLYEGSPLVMDNITSERRARRLVQPRHVAMWLCYKLIKDMSLPRVGVAFGRRDHTTIHHGCARAPEWMEESPLLRAAAMATLAHFQHNERGEPA
jgi:hypothetical protein